MIEQCLELWTAVLNKALSDIQYCPMFGLAASSPEEERRGAWEWFFSDSDDIGSFIWICHHLNLSEAAVRENILRTYAEPPVPYINHKDTEKRDEDTKRSKVRPEDRERILAMLRQGVPKKEIAISLGVSRQCVSDTSMGLGGKPRRTSPMTADEVDHAMKLRMDRKSYREIAQTLNATTATIRRALLAA